MTGSLSFDIIPEISLLVAREKYPELQFEHYLARLDEFASRAELHVKNVQGGRQIVEALNNYLFADEGFRGNTSDYYNPSNSFFNDVLDRRTGIPLTLSILYAEIGRRLGLPLAVVGFPGHALVRYRDRHETLFIDPFYSGKILAEEDCKLLLSEMYGGQLLFRPEYLNPATKREVLIRMLSNLKIIYMSKKEFEMALNILNKMLLFDPLAADSIKERGMVHYQLECYSSALRDFETYLMKEPTAADRSFIEECIAELRPKVDQMRGPKSRQPREGE
ncbi:MAG: transglutaminase family protein [Deltaproteobacteria bacterium]|nr:transglutaminase family protein [Deltaproteobacteria bacterium]